MPVRGEPALFSFLINSVDPDAFLCPAKAALLSFYQPC